MIRNEGDRSAVDNSSVPGTSNAKHAGTERNAADTAEALGRIMEATPLWLNRDQIDLSTAPTDTYPARVRPVTTPTIDVRLDSGHTVNPLHPMSTEAVLVDKISYKVELGKGVTEITSTRAARNRGQMESETAVRATEIAYFKDVRRGRRANNLQDPALTWTPYLQPGQNALEIPLETGSDAPYAHPYTSLILSRGARSSATGRDTVRYLKASKTGIAKR